MKDIKEFLRSTQSKARYQHSLSVAEQAAEWAPLVGVDAGRARLAGLLHDCAREMPGEDLRRLMALWPEGPDLSAHPAVWHAPAGAVLARSKWGVDDQIARAVAMHSPAQPGWDALGALIYLVDKIAPGRDYPGVERLREAFVADPNAGLLAVIADERRAAIAAGKDYHPAGEQARAAYAAQSPWPDIKQ